MPNIRKLLFFCLCLLCIDIALFIVTPCKRLTDWQQNTLADQNPITAAILFHDFSANNLGIDLETQRRLEHAVQLYRQGKINNLIVAGGFRSKRSDSGAHLMSQYLLTQNIPSSKIVQDHASADSIGNIDQILKLAKIFNWPRIVLISSPYHLQRISLILPPEPLQYLHLFAYNPCHSHTQASTFEIFRSAHYNFLAYLLWRMLPEPIFAALVQRRQNT